MKIIINNVWIWDREIQEFWILKMPDVNEDEIWKCVKEQYFK